MAIIYYDPADGRVYGESLVETQETLQYYAQYDQFYLDEAANPQLHSDLILNMNHYRVIGGELVKFEIPVQIEGQPDPHITVKQFWTAIQTAKGFLDTAISDWDGLTGAEKQTWIANNFDEVLRIERGILHLLEIVGKRLKDDLKEYLE